MSQDASFSGKGDYWQSYYAQRKSASVPLPSQFSVFIAGEMSEPHQVIDLGCGGGRDSFLFASHGHRVTGVDGSAAAIDNCIAVARDAGLEKAGFICSQITDADLAKSLARVEELPIMVYARFFLHAVSDEEEEKFFVLARALTSNGGRLAVEFRTMRDVAQEKVTASHYRRFIDPVQFNARALNVGFAASYFVEGFGFAKYKNDDAHVARFIFDRMT